MKKHSSAYYQIYRLVLTLALKLYVRFRYRIKNNAPPGAKLIVGNHPTVWDVFPSIVLFKKDVIHTLIEDQIWSLPLVRLVLTLTNQVRMYRGVESIRSLRQALAWLKRGDSLVVGPEGERTSVAETRAATRGVIWLALKARAPLIPIGLWIAEEDLKMKKVRYHHKNRSYTVDSYFPRFRGRYCWVIGEAIRLDRYYGRHLSPRERQEIADSLLETIYRLKEEARRLWERCR